MSSTKNKPHHLHHRTPPHTSPTWFRQTPPVQTKQRMAAHAVPHAQHLFKIIHATHAGKPLHHQPPKDAGQRREVPIGQVNGVDAAAAVDDEDGGAHKRHRGQPLVRVVRGVGRVGVGTERNPRLGDLVG